MLILCFLIVDVMEALLDVGFEFYQAVGNASGYQAVAIKGAGLVGAVPQLIPQRLKNQGRFGRNVRDVLVGFAPFLAVAHQHDRRAEIAGVADEAAGIAHRAGDPS